MKQQLRIAERECSLYEEKDAVFLLIQPVDEHDLEGMDSEVETLRSLNERPFSLLTVKVNSWEQDLTPWKAPAVFGKVPFGDGAADTLRLYTDQLLPVLTAQGVYRPAEMRLLLGGYSLAGLFALWAGYQTDVFHGIAAVSPSVWFQGWTDYATANVPLAKAVYLSLGDKEEKARNQVMASVGNAIRRQDVLLEEQGIRHTLEWNVGNHFVDADVRTAKGFAWLMNL